MNDDGLWVIYFDNNAARRPLIQHLRPGETRACPRMDGFAVVQGKQDAMQKFAAFHRDYRQHIADEAVRLRHMLPTAPRDAAESC